MSVEFAHVWWFLALIILPILVLWYVRRRTTYFPSMRFSDTHAFKNMSSSRTRLQEFLPLLRLPALFCLIIALARPQKLLMPVDMQTNGIDIIMALDLSGSMLAQDFEPNRLEVAKKVASEFVEKRPNDRIGLVVFSGEAITKCPLTIDHKIIQDMLATINVGQMQDGTAIGMGLATAVNRLKSSDAKSKIIILMTDGVNNTGYFKPEDALNLAKTFGIKVYTIGIGSKGEAMTPIQRADNGRFIFGLMPVEIDEVLLQRIADETTGKYYRATNNEELSRIYSEIDRLEKSKIEDKTWRNHVDLFQNWVLAAIFFVLLEIAARYVFFSRLVS